MGIIIQIEADSSPTPNDMNGTCDGSNVEPNSNSTSSRIVTRSPAKTATHCLFVEWNKINGRKVGKDRFLFFSNELSAAREASKWILQYLTTALSSEGIWEWGQMWRRKEFKKIVSRYAEWHHGRFMGPNIEIHEIEVAE